MPHFQLIWLMLSSALSAPGDIPASEISLGGIAVGESPLQVMKKLGEPSSKVHASGYLDLHYKYQNMTVSFSEGVVSGLFTDSASACTPKHLCPGDSLDRMRSLYGEPLEAVREADRFYEYYGHDMDCWLRIPVNGNKVDSIEVACQP